MNRVNFDKYITDFIACFLGIKEIWLIGSRANNCANDKSDWDILIFANESILNQLENDKSFCKQKIDLLVVYNDDGFKAPWDTDGKGIKQGSLLGWKWKQIDNKTALYAGERDFKEPCTYARKVWPNE